MAIITKVADLSPGLSGINLHVRVLRTVAVGETRSRGTTHPSVMQPASSEAASTTCTKSPTAVPSEVGMESQGEITSYPKARCADILVADETACVLVRAIDEQIDELRPEQHVFIANARTEVVPLLSHLRLIVDTGPTGYGSFLEKPLESKPTHNTLEGAKETKDLEEQLLNVSMTEWQYTGAA